MLTLEMQEEGSQSANVQLMHIQLGSQIRQLVLGITYEV